MEVLKLFIIVVYVVVLVWMIHAPVNLGIQSVHLHKEGKPGKAMIAIVSGWLIVGSLLLLGYVAGAKRIFG